MDTLQTERLILTKLSHQDNTFFIELVNTPGWLKFIGNRNIYSALEAQLYIQNILDNAQTTYRTVRLKEDQKPIGSVTLIKRDYLDSHDIGFAFLPSYMNMGYAYEAAHAVIEQVKKDQSHALLYATVLPENKSSIKLLTRLGFTFKTAIHPEDELLNLYQLTI